jgi:hypothetical protein
MKNYFNPEININEEFYSMLNNNIIKFIVNQITIRQHHNGKKNYFVYEYSAIMEGTYEMFQFKIENSQIYFYGGIRGYKSKKELLKNL